MSWSEAWFWRSSRLLIVLKIHSIRVFYCSSIWNVSYYYAILISTYLTLQLNTHKYATLKCSLKNYVSMTKLQPHLNLFTDNMDIRFTPRARFPSLCGRLPSADRDIGFHTKVNPCDGGCFIRIMTSLCNPLVTERIQSDLERSCLMSCFAWEGYGWPTAIGLEY